MPVPTTAHAAPPTAPTLAILPVRVEAGAAVGIDKQIAAAISAEVTRQGFVVHNDAAAKLPAKLLACADTDCASQVQALLEVEYLVTSTYFHMANGDSVTVTIVAPDGITYDDNALINATTPPATATTTATQRALDSQRRGPGPWLQISGSPAGAAVSINGKPIGELPEIKVRFESGVNHITARAPGYQPYNNIQDLAADSDDLVTLSIEMVPGDDSVATAGTESTGNATKPSVINYVVGTAFALVGVGLVTAGAIVLSGDGECNGSDTAGRCEHTYETGTTAAVLFTSAAAAFGGSVAVFALTPFTLDQSGKLTGFALQTHGSF